MPKMKNVKIKLFSLAGILIYCLVLWIAEIGCIFLKLTGVICPGCGMTRAVIALCKLDFKCAFSYHPLVLLLPLIFIYFLFDGKIFGKRTDIAILITIALAFVAVWVLRLFGVMPTSHLYF